MVVRTFASIVIDWNTASCDIAVLWSIGNVGEGYSAREAIADLEFCHLCCVVCMGLVLGKLVEKLRLLSEELIRDMEL
jgi:hypothetical protein